MSEKTGILTLISAVILGASVLGGAWVIRSSLSQASSELAALRSSLGSLPTVANAATGRANRPRQRPDPNRRYSVNTEGAPTRGLKSAKVSIVEFSDFQCPFCGRVTPTLQKIEKEYGDRVRIVFKHLPLSIHPKAPAAHAAAEAAHRQGKFWEMHDRIFANQRALEPDIFEGYAEAIGLDMDRYRVDIASADVKKRIDADMSEARRLGVTGTPGFFLNGRFVSGAQPFERFQTLIDEELDDSGAFVSRIDRDLKMRYIFRFEMEHLLARSGFEVEALYGDCFRGAFEDSSPEMVWIARQAE